MATYIGRTKAYYEYDEDSLYEPVTWEQSDIKDDPELVGEVHELTEDGVRELEWWLECKRMNQYQRTHCFGYRSENQEQMWEKLTDIKNGYIVY